MTSLSDCCLFYDINISRGSVRGAVKHVYVFINVCVYEVWWKFQLSLHCKFIGESMSEITMKIRCELTVFVFWNMVYNGKSGGWRRLFASYFMTSIQMPRSETTPETQSLATVSLRTSNETRDCANAVLSHKGHKNTKSVHPDDQQQCSCKQLS